MVFCNKCQQNMDASSFYTKPNGTIRKPCKLCQKNKRKEWISKNKDKLLEYDKDRYYSNKDYFRKMRRKRYLANRDSELSATRKWMKENPDRWRAIRKAVDHKRRDPSKGQLDASSIRSLESHNRREFESEYFTCEYCLEVIKGSYHLDHIIPLSSPLGTNELDNLAISCPNCNSGKGGKHTKLVEQFKPDRVQYFRERQIID